MTLKNRFNTMNTIAIVTATNATNAISAASSAGTAASTCAATPHATPEANTVNATHATPKLGFCAQVAHCEQHGAYPLNTLDARGHERWYVSGCPRCRQQARTLALLAACNIPKRFADCSFDNYQADSPAQQRVLARCQAYACDFAQHHAAGACLLLCGRPGTGKNHLASAICRHVLAQGYTVLRVKASQYLDLYWAKSFDERQRWLNELAAVDLLMIDEIGKSSQAKSAQDAFFALLDARYEAQLPNLLATNLNRAELLEVLGEASYDRLTQGGSLRLTLDWDSHRALGSRLAPITVPLTTPLATLPTTASVTLLPTITEPNPHTA